jgi:8-oxo-dGTP pyrophosphatase MutT (NUDIX family)
MGAQSPTGKPDPNKETKTISSAGGVILDQEDNVLVLKRRLEGTWVLPKGRRESGETLVDTALREVWEETGLENLRVERKIGMVRYTFYWRPEEVNFKKTVHYFLMRVDDGAGSSMKPEEDFIEHRWATLEKGVKLLTFENDRKIVRSLF